MSPRTLALATADTYIPGTETPPIGKHSVMKSECRQGENLNVKCSLAPDLFPSCQVLRDWRAWPRTLNSFSHLLACVLRRQLTSARTLPPFMMSWTCWRCRPSWKSFLPSSRLFLRRFVRFYEQLGKLNRVGVDIVTALPDIAGWQAWTWQVSQKTELNGQCPGSLTPAQRGGLGVEGAKGGREGGGGEEGQRTGGRGGKGGAWGWGELWNCWEWCFGNVSMCCCSPHFLTCSAMSISLAGLSITWSLVEKCVSRWFLLFPLCIRQQVFIIQCWSLVSYFAHEFCAFTRPALKFEVSQ